MGDGSTFQVADDAPRHYQEQVARFMLPLSAALVSAVVTTGDSVLDVACGTGIATRLAALTAGRSSKVVGSDLNRAMIEYARDVSAEEWPEIEWEEASALDLPYETAAFDRVICQQGVQFFPDPGAGLREMGRVAASGGNVAITVWSELSSTPYFEALAEMLTQFAGVEPADISFTATKPEILQWFTSGELPAPKIELVHEDVDLPPMSEYLPSHMKALPWGPAYFSLDDPARQAALKYVRDRMSDYTTADGVRTPFSSYLAYTGV